jgi:hypothetical protein
MKIRPAGAYLFHAGRRRDNHDETNSGFSQFCDSGDKWSHTSSIDKGKYGRYYALFFVDIEKTVYTLIFL